MVSVVGFPRDGFPRPCLTHHKQVSHSEDHPERSHAGGDYGQQRPDDNGLLEERTYDKNGQLLKIQETLTTLKLPKKYLLYEYKYDAEGNTIYEHKAEDGPQPEHKTTYTYDALNRLTGSTDAVSKAQKTYAYDTVGNLTQETNIISKTQHEITSYSYNNLNQQTQKQNISRTIATGNKNTDTIKETQTNTYDKRGNLIRTEQQNPNKILAQYTYDSTNRMTEGTNAKNETSAYRHNSLGALIGETKHIVKDAYTYTGVDLSPADKATRTCCASRPGTSHIETTCTIDYTSDLLDKLTEQETNGREYSYTYGLEKASLYIKDTDDYTFPLFYHHDKQGSVTNITCLDAYIRNSASYDAWGTPENVYESHVNGKRKLDIIAEYTTHAYDKVLQIYDAKARMYDPQNKRFMAQDIIAGFLKTPQTINRYAYVINNPKTYIDPTGLVYRSAQELAGSIGGAATYITDDAGAGYRISLGGKSYDYYEGTAYVWSFWQNDVFYLDDEGFYSHWGFSEIDRLISIEGKTVIVVEEGTGKGGTYNATVTVKTPQGETKTFEGSTLPTYPELQYKYPDDRYPATLDAGTYRLKHYTDRYKDDNDAPAYWVGPMEGGKFDGTDKLPCVRWSGEKTKEGERIYKTDTCDAIAFHLALDNNGQWSTGCITVLGEEKMREVGKMIGGPDKQKEAILIVIR